MFSRKTEQLPTHDLRDGVLADPIFDQAIAGRPCRGRIACDFSPVAAEFDHERAGRRRERK
jgi:hypothetical protein